MVHSICIESVPPRLYKGETKKTVVVRASQDENELMTVAQVAEYFKVNQQTVYRWLNKGKLPVEKIGRMVRVKRKNLAQLLDRSSKTNNIKRGESTRSSQVLKRKRKPLWEN